MLHSKRLVGIALCSDMADNLKLHAIRQLLEFEFVIR